MPKTINSWDSLRMYGINVLTGEACGLSMRLLCNVNKKGIEIIEEFFGNTIKVEMRKGWNDEENGSIMLTNGIFLELAAFVLLKNGHSHAMIYGQVVYGFTNEEWKERGEKLYEHAINYNNEGNAIKLFRIHGTAGTRNVHAMSGRIT